MALSHESEPSMTSDETSQRQAIRVFLLDDHEVVRQGLRALVEADGSIEVVGESGSAREATSRIPALRPDVAILDGRLPDGSGVLVKTRDAERFYRMLNQIALSDILIEGVIPADDNVNSVYEYLIGSEEGAAK